MCHMRSFIKDKAYNIKINLFRRFQIQYIIQSLESFILHKSYLDIEKYIEGFQRKDVFSPENLSI